MFLENICQFIFKFTPKKLSLFSKIYIFHALFKFMFFLKPN
jgi:hypothetical protein